MRVRIEKGTAQGTITAPPSKSLSHRMLIAAALSDGVSTVRGVSRCADVLATIDCLTALGAAFSWRGEDVVVRGADLHQARPEKPLYCRESGSTLRFLLPLALLSGHPATLTGAESLMRRPMAVYETLAAEKGFSYRSEAGHLTVCGPLQGGEYRLPGDVSSQFITGLLFALPLMAHESTIRLTTAVESRSYIDLTIEALRAFGVIVSWLDPQTLSVEGDQRYRPADVTVERDASGAAFPAALNCLGGAVTVEGIDPTTAQGDAVYPALFAALSAGAPTISLADCPDLAPILFTVAAAKHGGVFRDTRRLKIKESDRAAVMAAELRKFGAQLTVEENTVTVVPAPLHAPAETLLGHNDHRIVMSLAVLCTCTGGEIDGAEAVDKSYPDFFRHLRCLGINAEEVH